jgi:toxin ParE1/3/4
VNVFVRTAARDDILRQYRYYVLEKNAAVVGERFIEAVESTIQTICRNPAIGAPRFLKHPKLAGLRSWPVSGFPMMRAYYICTGDNLRIIRILHGRRDVNAILEEEPIDSDI